MNMPHADGVYGFESAEAASLNLIPLSIRYRLDACAIKLHLQQWQRLLVSEREQLMRMPFACADESSAWTVCLTALLQHRCGCLPDRLTDTALPDWQQLDDWPSVIIERCIELDIALPAVAAWRGLCAPDRHALFKLARSRHEYTLLAAALLELIGDVEHAHRV